MSSKAPPSAITSPRSMPTRTAKSTARNSKPTSKNKLKKTLKSLPVKTSRPRKLKKSRDCKWSQATNCQDEKLNKSVQPLNEPVDSARCSHRPKGAIGALGADARSRFGFMLLGRRIANRSIDLAIHAVRIDSHGEPAQASHSRISG